MAIQLFKNKGLYKLQSDLQYKYVVVKSSDNQTLAFPIINLQVKHTPDISIQKVLSRDLIVADFGQNPVLITLIGVVPCQAGSTDSEIKNISLKKLVQTYNTKLSDKSKPTVITIDGVTYKGIISYLTYKSYNQFPSVLIYTMSFIAGPS